MALTPAQQATLKAFVEADPVFSLLSPSNGSALQIANALNAPTNPAFILWRSNVPLSEINNAIVWANMTPAQAIPTTGSDAQLLWIAKSMACQGKQFNLQTLLYTYADGVNATLQNIRNAFQDCLTNIPSTGAGGITGAGWPAVQTVMQRTANGIEKLLSTGTGTVGSPAVATLEGEINYVDVVLAMGWPY
jgi:hypothetical protein